jgi:hypothetical protein
VRGVAIAAWSVFILDTGLVMLVLAFGIAASDSVERDTMFGLATLASVPLAVLFAGLGLSTVYRKPTGLWICLALGAVPLILWLIIVAQQNFL